MRAGSLAKKQQHNNYYDFWKEVKVLNNCKISLPSDMGVSGTEELVEKWRYQELSNCIKSAEACVLNNIDSSENIVIIPDEIIYVG